MAVKVCMEICGEEMKMNGMDYLNCCFVVLMCMSICMLLYVLSLPEETRVQHEDLYPIFAFCIGFSILVIIFKVINSKAEEKNQQNLYR